jgi:1-acyl-sn-glycerol-3-phosphate acyltransferase
MLRTLYGFMIMWGYLFYSIPTLIRLRKLPTTISVAERDILVHKMPKHWASKVVKSTGANVEVNGLEHLPEGPVLFVSNHQGNFDIPLLMSHIPKPMGFISKIEVKKLPIISSWMEILPCVFMDRKDRRQAVKSIQNGADLLKSGHSLVIFPEGTRSKGGPVSEFKTGSFRLATKSHVPIVPITIDGSYKLFEEKGNLFHPGNVTITVNKPIHSDYYEQVSVKELSELVQKSIQNNIDDIQQ